MQVGYEKFWPDGQSRGFVAVKRDEKGKVTDAVAVYRGSEGARDWAANTAEATGGVCMGVMVLIPRRISFTILLLGHCLNRIMYTYIEYVYAYSKPS